MPAPITPVSAWTALQKPVGTDVANRASIDDALQPLADRIEFLKDKALGGIISWPRVGITRIASLASAVPDNTSAIGWFVTRPFWTATTADSQYLLCPLNGIIDTGEIITDFDALAKPGAARSSGNAMLFDLCCVTHDWLTPASEPVAVTVIASAHDDGTANKQRIVATAFSHTVDLALNDYFLRVRSGNTASSASDSLYALRLFITKPSVGQP